jgi:alpha-L-glutamate ligase-like protein
MLAITRALKRKGVLAVNRRNAEYTLKHNQRCLYPLVDDKLVTKRLALDHGVAVPELYGVIEVEGQVRRFRQIIGPREDFVIKPGHGSGGEGILVIAGRMNDKYRKQDGIILSQEELDYHVFSVLAGLYSLGGQPDSALIEYRVQFHPVFESITYLGVPDIRIIVFLGVPVMSMVRLPTRMSDGKANLHQGALGAGIDLAEGRTLTAVWGNETVSEHPDTGRPVAGIEIPFWPDLLELAARCYEITGLGYQGVDIVLDRDKGPLLLELNARPGLNIQIANQAGLIPRLDIVEQEHSNLSTVSERVELARHHFRA